MHCLDPPGQPFSTPRARLHLQRINALTPPYSKSLGSPSPLRRPQLGRPRAVCRLLHPLPHPQSQASKVCHSVRCPLFPTYLSHTRALSSLHCLTRLSFSLFWCLDLPRSLTHISALPRFSRPRLARFACGLLLLLSSHTKLSPVMAQHGRWCACTRIQRIIDVVALTGRARQATIPRRTLRQWEGPPDHKLKACPAARPHVVHHKRAIAHSFIPSP